MTLEIKGAPISGSGPGGWLERARQEAKKTGVKGVYEDKNFPGSTMVRGEDGYTYALRKREDGGLEGNQIVLNSERTEVLSTQKLPVSFFEDPKNELILKEAEKQGNSPN